MKSFDKDPDAVLDYVWDWTDWLADSEHITNAVVLTPPGITCTSHPATTTQVTAWLTGGTPGQRYTVTCRITTDQGRTEDRSVLIRAVDR